MDGVLGKVAPGSCGERRCFLRSEGDSPFGSDSSCMARQSRTTSGGRRNRPLQATAFLFLLVSLVYFDHGNHEYAAGAVIE